MSLSGTLDDVHAQSTSMPFSRIEIHDDFASCAANWSRLEASATTSWYQTRHWASAWCESVGKASGAHLQILVAFDATDLPCLLLPLVVVRKGLLYQAQYCGAKDSNFNLPLFRPQDSWDRASVRLLLQQAASQLRPRPDNFALLNQPGQWDGVVNPLALLASQASPSFGHRGALQRRSDILLEGLLSNDHRKKLARKLRRLQTLGPTQCSFAETSEIIEAAIQAFCAQKAERLLQMGVASKAADDTTLDFLRRLSLPGEQGEPARMRWAILTVRDSIVATYGGGIHRGQFQAMVNSMSLDPEIARSSPGECLLNWLVARCCADGLTRFDLGTGEGSYKKSYCPTVEPLFDAFIPVSVAGFAASNVQRAVLHVKRIIKQNAGLWAAARKIRKLRGSAKNPAASNSPAPPQA